MDALAYITAEQDRFLEQLKELLRIPSVSALSERRADVARAADWVAADLRAIGLDGVAVIADPEGGHPLVYGEWLPAGLRCCSTVIMTYSRPIRLTCG